MSTVSNTILCLQLIVALFMVTTQAHYHSRILSDHFIAEINRVNSTWVAGRNFPLGTRQNYLRALLGVHQLAHKQLPPPVIHILGKESLPKKFDSREEWPECPTIRFIMDQAGCGSCWAVSSAAVMSDRICIHSQGSQHVHVSTQNLLSCCHDCAPKGGCNGGWPSRAFSFWNTMGLVTGGEYGSNEGCQPYLIPPYGEVTETPECVKTCEDPKISYEKDKSFGKISYSIKKDVKQIQKELMKNGPVVTYFTVYEDFNSYKSGVYQHVMGIKLGLHAVRILGWGKEEETPYWLVANSWGQNWGVNGTFKILRGEDHCGIESHVVAGKPKL